MSSKQKYPERMMPYRKQYISFKGHLQLLYAIKNMPLFLPYGGKVSHGYPDLRIFLWIQRKNGGF